MKILGKWILIVLLVLTFIMVFNTLCLAKTEVTLWTIAAERRDEVFKNKIIPEFQKEYPDIEINYQTYPDADYKEKLLAAMSADRGPDITWANIPFLMEMGFARPIPESLVTDEYMEENYLPGKDYKYKGKRYFIPSGTMGSILYYNKKILQDAGIDPKTIGSTWEEAAETYKKLTDWNGDFLMQAGFAFNGMVPTLLGDYTRQQGMSPFVKTKEGDSKLDFNNDRTKQAIGYIKDLYDKYKVNSRGFLNWNEALGTGKAAIVPWWTWGGSFLEATYPDLEWGTATRPRYKGTGPYGYCNEMDTVYFVTTSAKGEELEAAWKFWEFISMRDENIRIICRGAGVIPLKKSLLDDPWISERPDFLTLKEQMLDPTGGQIFFGSAISRWSEALSKAAEEILYTGADINSVLEKYEGYVNEDLEISDYWILDLREE